VRNARGLSLVRMLCGSLRHTLANRCRVHHPLKVICRSYVSLWRNACGE
jgi:hypothetical protein